MKNKETTHFIEKKSAHIEVSNTFYTRKIATALIVKKRET